MVKTYVLGFCFSRDRSSVALVIKNRPDWQAGKVNGIGGKVELQDTTDISSHFSFLPGKQFYQAMFREFKEEAGIEVLNWDLFATMTFNDDILGGKAIVKCFRAFTDDVYFANTQESEQIVIVRLEDLNSYPLLMNVPMLIEMALNKDLKIGELELN